VDFRRLDYASFSRDRRCDTNPLISAGVTPVAQQKWHGLEIVHKHYNAAVKGADAVDVRPGFAAMIAYMSGNGARTILVENASRFARDLIVQETGYQYLQKLGFTLIAVDDPDAFTSDTPTAVLIRQILGAVSQFEKASLVAKLAGARLRKRQTTGRCEGPKQAPKAGRLLAQTLRADGLALRAIADRLGKRGFYHRLAPPTDRKASSACSVCPRRLPETVRAHSVACTSGGFEHW
jgi:DNA invertase Pin-like site-specific DNA recombinase